MQVGVSIYNRMRVVFNELTLLQLRNGIRNIAFISPFLLVHGERTNHLAEWFETDYQYFECP